MNSPGSTAHDEPSNSRCSARDAGRPSAPPLQPLRCILLLLTVSGLLAPATAIAAEPSGEYRLKAAIVSKLPQFVQWPPVAWSGRSTLDFCVLTPNPFGPALQELVAGEQIDGHPQQVRDVHVAADLDGCHVLFVSGTSRQRRAQQAALSRAATLPILTIGDDPEFATEGGIVGLELVNGRVRFAIDVVAADRVGIRLSSQLLQLALHVHGRPE